MLISKESTALNPKELFFQECLEHTEERCESSYLITQMFKRFCITNGLEGDFNIRRFLNKRNISEKRKRIDALGYASSDAFPQFVFEGIRLRDEYRVT